MAVLPEFLKRDEYSINSDAAQFSICGGTLMRLTPAAHRARDVVQSFKAISPGTIQAPGPIRAEPDKSGANSGKTRLPILALFIRYFGEQNIGNRELVTGGQGAQGAVNVFGPACVQRVHRA